MDRKQPGGFVFGSALLAGILSMSLASCGGGGGDSGSPGDGFVAPPVEPGAGVVGLIFTDAPSDEFAEINVTISGATLIGGPGQVTLFSGRETLNLLDLENFEEVFAIAEDVPAGDYSKIRLQVESLELVVEDDEGTVVEVIEPKLPGNGKLDLNPQGPFTVSPGGTLLIRIDWDVDKSIHLVETGNGEWIFRPVLFVDVLGDDVLGGLTRVHGTIVEVDPDAGTLVLCSEDFDDEDEDERDDDFDDCVIVHLADDTGIFDANGDPTDVAALVPGLAVTAIGTLRSGDDDLDDDDDLWLDAAVIEIGPPGTFAAFAGIILSELDEATGQFDFELEAGQGFAEGSTVVVQVQDGTRVFDEAGNPLDTSAIAVDLRAEVEGVLQLADEEPDLLKAALLVLDLEADEEASRISGEILSIDLDDQTLMLATGEGDRCVRLDDDADVFLVTVTDSEATSAMVDLAALEAGMQADAYGEFEVDGCFEAETLIGFASEQQLLPSR